MAKGDIRSTGLHSAEYFGESRDHWWNDDFLALMARRWRLPAVRKVLDLGSGVGHWGRALAPHLPGGAEVTGVDREARWVAEATALAEARGLAPRFRYVQGDAMALPFEAGTFDLVTCQTVLIHVGDVAAVLREMVRVTAPGGLVGVAEPNNLDWSPDTVAVGSDVDDVIARFGLQMRCERGKAALGLGDNSVGPLLPGLFGSAGLADVEVHLSDKASPLTPPYATARERATIEELRDWTTRDFWIWDRDETERYYRAGGGDPARFAAAYRHAMDARRRMLAEIDAGTYRSGGGAMTFVVSGRRPPNG
ncbi:MAG: class I SAM-dependent methyltransferase [Polyangiaceae bacterium]